MAKTIDDNSRKIQKIKRSYYVTLPIEYVRGFGWDENRDVMVRRINRGLVIESGARWKRRENKQKLP